MITLTTLNARYSHTSMGLRYLIANMGELIPQTTITEFTIQQRPIDIVEELLTNRPRIIGFGVYIWNVRETTEVVTLIKAVSPETLIILGGPEVSYEWEEQKIVQQADYLLTGMSELEFAPLCQ
ncbi:MAG: cobalamin B12-binding domain-containing protein, partial [Gammaproteobacteria bacterium]|nr:cobalamin B12-binding domain-containing protein [Gammaproteobacteria bacterium]